MNRLLVPTDGVSDWRLRLADPEKHWKRTASAFETAISWEGASRTSRGLPVAISEVLDQAPELRGAALLIGLPEHKVALPGGSRASQTDVWTLLKVPSGLISMAVEAKAEESFGDTLEVWRKPPADSKKSRISDGKVKRLNHLCEALQCGSLFPESTRYQLLHRTASAVIEARRFGAAHAVMMVQAFRPTCDSLNDYAAFGQCFGVSLSIGTLARLPQHTNPTLYLGWAVSPLCSDSDIVKVVE